VLQHCNPVPQMLHEHDLGRALVKRMQEAIYSQDKDEFIDAMKTYTNLLTDHIYKEDNILYPMAESSLTTSQKTEIQKEYHEAQARMNADEIWRKYKSFSSDLEAKLQGTCC